MAYDSAHPEREQALSLYLQQTADEEIRPSAIEPAEAFRAGWDACVVRHPHQDVEREAELRLDLAQLAECDLPLVDCPPCQERASRLGAALGGTQ